MCAYIWGDTLCLHARPQSGDSVCRPHRPLRRGGRLLLKTTGQETPASLTLGGRAGCTPSRRLPGRRGEGAKAAGNRDIPPGGAGAQPRSPAAAPRGGRTCAEGSSDSAWDRRLSPPRAVAPAGGASAPASLESPITSVQGRRGAAGPEQPPQEPGPSDAAAQQSAHLGRRSHHTSGLAQEGVTAARPRLASFAPEARPRLPRRQPPSRRGGRCSAPAPVRASLEDHFSR